MLRWTTVGCALLAACSFAGAPGSSVEPDPDAAAPSCVPAPAGIVGWWDGEDVGIDRTGNASATQIRGNPTTDTGMVGNATRFGTDDIFEIDPAPTPANFTIEGWMNLGVANPTAWIGLYGRFAESSACIYQNRLTYWEGSVGGGGSNGNLALGSELATNTWYHIAITWDGNTARTYLDGMLDGQETVGGNVALPDEVGIGGIFNGEGDLRDPFVGLLDELTLYSRALEAGEIAAIAAAGSAGKCTD